jgi:hypothetical protein
MSIDISSNRVTTPQKLHGVTDISTRSLNVETVVIFGNKLS